MLRLASYDIVFQEIPGEVTLALNISGCPNRCPSCHSPHLWEDIGEELDEELLSGLLAKYSPGITCVCFMGGDSDPLEVGRLSVFVRESAAGRIKIGWYSGKTGFATECSLENFDFLKLGPYVEKLGGLDSAPTNQRFYAIENGRMIDHTDRFRK